MGWNESPGGDKDKDPSGSRGDNGGPPDLDEILRRMQEGLGGLFGRRPITPAGSGGPSFALIVVLSVLLLWLVYDTAYTIDQQERGIVLRFGKYVTTLQPGLNFRLPHPIEDVIIINVGQVRPLTHKSVMLTQDENIVDLEVAVQWRIKDPVAYQFNVVAPDTTLQQATESAVREVIGKSELDFVLTEGRGQIAQSQQTLIQQIMDDYQTGIEILGVKMQPAKPPEEVKSAFDDAIKAREDEQRLVNEAEAYRNDLIPRARGGAARLREEANAYKSRIVSRAEGDASRFEQQLTEYEKAPEVTRQRLYIESMEKVLSNTSKVLVDIHGANNLIYLPIDKIMEQRPDLQVPEPQKDSTPAAEAPASTPTGEANERSSTRARGAR
jgi:membrane protease subunit HflK